ncbi:MAG: hypothetical protein RSP_22470 [Rhodanobacter sp.]
MMGNADDLLLLLALVAVIALWLKLSRAREHAATEARMQCGRYGVQLLDETVGLRALRLRHADGRLRLERCYGFEVSIDGADREPASLWMLGDRLSELRLPTVVLAAAEPASVPARHAATAETADEAPTGRNVIPLRPRRRPDGGDTRH